ncbi:MAG: glycosyltransferase [Bradymonadia bacterium]
MSTPVELVDVPMGASRTDIGNALSDHLRHFAATHKPSVIHCVGLPAAAGALFGTRGQVPIVVEPGATAAQRARDLERPTAASALLDRVAQEDAILQRAHRVIARTPLEAATLVKRGVPTERTLVVPEGLVDFELDTSSMTELPVLGTVVLDEGDVDVSLLAAALERIRQPWRLMVFFDPGVTSGADLSRQFERALQARIEYIAIDKLNLWRLTSLRIMVTPIRAGRMLSSGAYIPESVVWGLKLERPTVMPDSGSPRLIAGAGGIYYRADDPGHLAEWIERLLADGEAGQNAYAEARAQAARCGWSQAEALIKGLWVELLPNNHY